MADDEDPFLVTEPMFSVQTKMGEVRCGGLV